MINASRTTVEFIVLSNNTVSLRLLIWERIEARTMARVVTLIPPAVDPGAAPINITHIVKISEAFVSSLVGIVEKPAFLD